MSTRPSAGYVAIVLVAAPVLAGCLYSAAAALGLAGAGASGFDGSRLVRVLDDPVTWQSIGWTIYTAGTATVLATLAALVLSVRLRHSRAGRLLTTLPLGVPYVATGLAALLLLSQSGLLARVAFAAGLIDQPAAFPELVYDSPGVALILSYAWKELPFLALTAFAVLDTGGTALDDAARSLGASARDTLTRVTLPLLWRGVAPAAIAAYAYLVGQYELAALLAPSDPQALSVLTYERAQDPDLAMRGDAHALGLLAMLLCGALVFWHERARYVAARTMERGE